MKTHDDIVDNLREQLVFLDRHPDFNESCTTLYIFEAITEINKLRKLLYYSDRNINNWISVKDRLPEIETDVLVCGIRFKSWYTTAAGLFDDKWVSQETERDTLFDVTHWMPLPEPPKA